MLRSGTDDDRVGMGKKNRVARPQKKAQKPKKITKAMLAKQARAHRRARLKSWSVRVRTRDGYKCCVCGNPANTQSHHVLPKAKFHQYEFEDANGITLCPTHHCWGKFSAEGNAVWFAEWLRENRPDQWRWAKDRIAHELALIGAPENKSENPGDK